MKRRTIKMRNSKEEYVNGEKIHLKDFIISKEDIIQKEKLVESAKINNISFCSYEDFQFNRLNINIDKYFFHLGDEPFDEKKLNKIQEKSYTKIYSVNCEINHPKIYPIPLGVTDTSWCSLIGDLDIIIEFNKTEKKHINLAYINFNTERKDLGFPCREKIKNLFSKKPWATDSVFMRNKEGHREFIKNIYNHKFVFCPRGNGVDTHRLWMTLYLRSIPIVLKHETNYQFRHLPILFVETWESVNEELLNLKWEEFNNKVYDFSLLKMSFWNRLFNT